MIAGVATGGFMAIAALTGHVDLYPDAIAVGYAIGGRRLERADIVGKQKLMIYVTTFILYPRDKKQKPLKIGLSGSEDKYFFDSMNSIPDMDQASLKRLRV